MESLPDARHQRLLEWLTTVRADRNPKTKTALAEEFGVHIRTLRDWESKPEFVKAHAERARMIVGSPERTKAVLDALHATALDTDSRQHVAAAKVYLEAVDYIKPHPHVRNPSGGDSGALSNERIEELIAERLTEQADARGLHIVKDA